MNLSIARAEVNKSAYRVLLAEGKVVSEVR